MPHGHPDNPIASDAICMADKALMAAGLPTYEECREALAAFLALTVGSDEAEAMRLDAKTVAAIREAERITSA